MTRSTRHILRIGILGAAAVGLLAFLFFGGSGERTADTPTLVKSPAAADRMPAATPQREDGAQPVPGDAARPSRPEAKAQEAGPERHEDGTAPGERLDPATIQARHGKEPLTPNHPHMAPAIEVQERNTDWLLDHPAVVGTGVGLNDKGEVALVVMTKVAGVSDIPGVIEGLPVVIWQTGEIHVRTQGVASLPVPMTLQAAVNPKARFPRPVPIGVSTSLAAKYTKPYITAGTIGCSVSKNGQVFALSNNHVYANGNKAPLGAAVLQPGTLDGGVDADQFGTLAEYKPIVFGGKGANTMDAAIALMNSGALDTSTPTDGYGIPSATTLAAVPGMAVAKYGRTTGPTTGSVTTINVSVKIQYSNGIAKFVGQIVITPGSFSASGDSGSLIVKQGTLESVGLLFAGSSSTTIANPIGAVLDHFGVSISQP